MSSTAVKRPLQAFRRKTRGQVRIPGNVFQIIEIEELKMPHLNVNGQGDKVQGQANKDGVLIRETEYTFTP